MNSDTFLRKLTPDDANAVAVLHFEAFKDFFLTSLGISFLKVFYKSVLQHPDAIALGSFSNGLLVGFAIGTVNNSGFYGSILRGHAVKLLWAALPQLMSPVRLKRLFNSLTTKGDADYQGVPMLLSICVAKTVESKGIGKAMLTAFEEEVKRNDKNCLILSTDADNNAYVNQFYCNNNYIFVKNFLQGKRRMNLYTKKFII